MCKEHLKKFHQDPMNENVFEKICESCDCKYLNSLIYDDFRKKHAEKKARINSLQLELQNLESKTQKKNNQILQTKMEVL